MPAKEAVQYFSIMI